jgi:hypothetical protein
MFHATPDPLDSKILTFCGGRFTIDPGTFSAIVGSARGS